jgi:hypothetical protein
VTAGAAEGAATPRTWKESPVGPTHARQGREETASPETLRGAESRQTRMSPSYPHMPVVNQPRQTVFPKRAASSLTSGPHCPVIMALLAARVLPRVVTLHKSRLPVASAQPERCLAPSLRQRDTAATVRTFDCSCDCGPGMHFGWTE